MKRRPILALTALASLERALSGVADPTREPSPIAEERKNMHGSQLLRVAGVWLVVGALLVAGTASARADQGRRLPTLTGASCAVHTALQRGPLGSDSQTSPARGAALQEYDDGILDVVSAPDICMANVVTNDNQTITMGIHVHDRAGFAALDTYRILLNADSNATTGAPADAGAAAGAEFVIDIADGASRLSSWNGSSFEPVVPQPEIPTAWSDDYGGPALQVGRAALGDPQAFNFILETANGEDLDLAPDSGSWSYAVTPLQLTAGRLAVGPARAGKPLAVAMEVERSDFEIALDEGAIVCRATVAGQRLAGRGLFAGDLVVCSWRLPKNARGKRVTGSVSVTFQGVTAKRSFAVKVR